MAVTISRTRSREPIEFTLNGESQLEYTPAGNTTEIQFNNAGEMAGDSRFTYDPATNVFDVGKVTADTVTLTASDANSHQLRFLTASAAPTGGALVDGAIWFDNTALYMRINGVTYTFDVTSV